MVGEGNLNCHLVLFPRSLLLFPCAQQLFFTSFFVFFCFNYYYYCCCLYIDIKLKLSDEFSASLAASPSKLKSHIITYRNPLCRTNNPSGLCISSAQLNCSEVCISSWHVVFNFQFFLYFFLVSQKATPTTSCVCCEKR